MLKFSDSEGRERPHLPQACPLPGQPYDVASYPAYSHNASHSQDIGWISLGCKQVGEPVACALMPGPCHICCMGTSLHSVPPCVFTSLWWLGSSLSHTGHTVASLSTAVSWYGTSATLRASAPLGRSSPHRRADTCCFILLRAHLLTTTSPSPTGVGVANCGGPSLAAWPLHAIPSC